MNFAVSNGHGQHTITSGLKRRGVSTLRAPKGMPVPASRQLHVNNKNAGRVRKNRQNFIENVQKLAIIKKIFACGSGAQAQSI